MKGIFREGGDAHWRDSKFLWSRVLTHPWRFYPTRHSNIQGRRGCRGQMVAILD